MATIKLQNGKVITKDGKVSCECCDLCCFYPAQGLFDGDYTIDDLPDEIEMILQNLGLGLDGTYLLSKNDPPLTDYRGFLTYYGNPKEGYIYINSTLTNGKLRATWFYAGDGGLVETDFPCIVYPAVFSTDFQTRDKFADTYSVTGPLGPSGESITEIAKRGPLTGPDSSDRFYYNCAWRSSNFTLRYSGGIEKTPPGNVSGSYKWSVNGNNKSGNQNTPVGSYAGGYSVE